MNFFLTPNIEINLSDFVPSYDLLIKGKQSNDNSLVYKTKYSIMTAMNIRRLKETTLWLKNEERVNIIILTNRIDIAELRRIQASKVACVKAIIWYNSTCRGFNFPEASDSTEYLHVMSQYDEDRGEINEVTSEYQKLKKNLRKGKK